MVIVIQLLLAAGAARVAESRGRNVFVYFIFCFFIPLAAIIAVPYLLIFTRRIPQEERVASAIPVRLAEQPDRVAQLERLGRLRETGVLSPDEFEREKARLLGE